MTNGDSQQAALSKAISNFWDATDVPQETSPVKIASYPSLESLNEELKEELMEAEYEYYTKKRMILVEKMAMANAIYLAHLQNYEKQDPKDRSQRYLLQFNELNNKLHEQFDIVVAKLSLPYKKPLTTYPSFGNLMDAIQQKNMEDKNREYFREMVEEIKIKNNIAQKVRDNRLSMNRAPEEKGKADLQYREYQRESRKLLDFCERMMEKREKEANSIELEQPERVPRVREISKEKLNEKRNNIIDQPQYVKPIGENALLPYYSREMSRYEPPNPTKQKEREDLIEKVKEITGEESKGGKREKSVEVDTDLSWDHEGLKPLPKAPKDKLNGSPKPPRTPRVPKAKVNAVETFKKERYPPAFNLNDNDPVKVLQKQRATHHAGYEQPPQYLMGAQRDQAPQPPMDVTNKRDGSWRSQGKRYPLKGRWRTWWGGYGKQYGAGGERRSYQTYRADRTQTQSHNTAYESQRQGSYFPTKSTGNGQGGNGGGEDRKDKKK